jgi:hypothetical protein
VNGDAQKYLRSFSVIGKLYQHFRSQDLLPAKNHYGRTPPSELDFVIDVDRIAKRVLTPEDHTEFHRVCLSDALWLLPKLTQFVLGAAWERAGLGIGGDYRGLFRFGSEERRREHQESEEHWQQLKGKLSEEIPDETFEVQDIFEHPKVEAEPFVWLG